MPLFSRITRYLRWPIYDARRRENEAWCFHCQEAFDAPEILLCWCYDYTGTQIPA